MAFQSAYRRGSATAVVTPSAWLLVDLPVDDRAIDLAWRAMNVGGSDPLLLLEGLLLGGLAAMPSFALVTTHNEGVKIYQRGGLRVFVNATAYTSGAEHSGWLEQIVTVDDRTQITLQSGEPALDGVELPANAGVFAASSIHINLTGDQVDASVADSPPFELAPVQPSPPAGAPPEELREPPTPPPPPAPPDLVAPLYTPSIDEVANSDDEGSDYAELFGVTIDRNIEDAAVRDSTEEQNEQYLPPSKQTGVGLPPVLLPPVAPRPKAVTNAQATPESGFLISSVPVPASDTNAPSTSLPSIQATPNVPAFIAENTATFADADDEIETNTVPRASLSAAAQPPDTMAPSVQATFCPSRHLNPPDAANCRHCHAPVPPQAPMVVLRPPLGSLSFTNGANVILDRNVRIGRGPTTATNESDRPHLFKVNNSTGEISRNHVQVVLDGWHVLVEDLRSTNGTLVLVPGSEPQMLHGGVKVPIKPGTTVRLAEDLAFTYEVSS